MELVRTLGQTSWARHGIWLGQHGQESALRISENVEPHEVIETIEFRGLEVWGPLGLTYKALGKECLLYFHITSIKRRYLR